MQHLCNQWFDFKNYWSCLMLTLLWIWRYTMYPLHLNYTTTLPCKAITMKITIFIIVLVLKSNENMKIWHFRLSKLANSSKPCENRLFWRCVQSVRPQLSKAFTQARSLFDKAQYGLVDGVLWQIIPCCVQDFLQLADGIWYVTNL